jgi:HEAT repeat protein
LQAAQAQQLLYRSFLAKAYSADENTLRASLRSQRPVERFAATYVVGERQLAWQPELIERLTDPKFTVRMAARRSLVVLSYFELRSESPDGSAPTKKAPPKVVDFGPQPGANVAAQKKAAKQWADWWEARGKGGPAKPSAQPRGAAAVVAATAEDVEAARLTAILAFAEPARQAELLANYRDAKGIVYTEALADVLPRLDDDTRRTAQDYLAQRLTRMTIATVLDRFDDSRAEVRRAAALAAAKKEDRSAVPALIPLLHDSEEFVSLAAKTTLVRLTGEDFGPAPGASADDRARAAADWRGWWQSEGRLR